jgi:hypothetical protein
LKTDQNIEYSKHIAENVNSRTEYQDYVNEHTDKVIDYQNYLVEGIDAVANYSEYIKENLENLGNYTDYIATSINENGVAKQKITDAVNEEETTKEVVEENIINETVTFKTELNDKIQALVESAKKQKVEETAANTHFLHFLNEDRREEFKSFDDESKAKVIRAYESEDWFGSAEVSGIWESVFTPVEKTINWLDNMPSKYANSWDSLDESQKNAIKGQATMRNLDTQYKIDHFWSTRELRAINPSEQINEAPKMVVENESPDYETSSAYMESVAEGLKKRFNK